MIGGKIFEFGERAEFAKPSPKPKELITLIGFPLLDRL